MPFGPLQNKMTYNLECSLDELYNGTQKEFTIQHMTHKGPKSTKYVIVCNVHIGDICQGYSTMNIHPKMRDRDKQYDTSVDNIRSPKQFIKKKNGTYNILGIITIKNYIDKSKNKFNGGFQIINTKKYPIILYWIPPNVRQQSICQLNTRMCKKLCVIPSSEDSNRGTIHGTTKQLSQIGHTFACVTPGPSNNYIIKIFKSKQRGEIITI